MTTHASPAQDCSGDPIDSRGIVCFTVPAGASDVSFRVRDGSGRAVGGTAWRYDAGGAMRDAALFCESGGFPADPGDLVILRMEPVNGPLACLDAGHSDAGIATRGFVALRTS